MKYIETSPGINHNVDELLVGMLAQIQLRIEANAAALGVDLARMALMGDSAGGGLTAAVAQWHQDRAPGDTARANIRAQAMIYPTLDNSCSTLAHLYIPHDTGLVDATGDNLVGVCLVPVT